MRSLVAAACMLAAARLPHARDLSPLFPHVVAASHAAHHQDSVAAAATSATATMTGSCAMELLQELLVELLAEEFAEGALPSHEIS